jgi:AraC-like DNA-binding protein/mannose-6-phosphate isomerase-like protein (cupin superfamily)
MLAEFQVSARASLTGFRVPGPLIGDQEIEPSSVNPDTRDLLAYLAELRHEPFAPEGRIDGRRYLARDFSTELPLTLVLQEYPQYRQMVGENWMHWHDYYELFVALSGAGEFRVGNDRFAFRSGDVVLVDPLKIHGVTRMEASHTALVILFQAAAVAPTGAALDRSFLSAWDRRSEKTLPRLRGEDTTGGAVHGAVLRLARAWFEHPPGEGRTLELKFHFLEILFHLGRGFESNQGREEPATARGLREARLHRALEYLSLHCHGPVSQEEVAHAAGMSCSRFRAFFKQTTGWGFGDYLRDLRLERAATLLRESAASVAEVAYRTGFADQSHLQRLFKGKYAISPLAYRKQQVVRDGGERIIQKIGRSVQAR